MLGIVKIGEYTIDFSRQKILKGTDVVNLSKKITGASAWKFLELSINANGRILTYEFLDGSGIWRDDGGKGVDHRSSIKTWASAFNKALEGSPIKNKSGVGYYFDMKDVEKTQETLCQIAEGDILYPRTIYDGVAQMDPEEAAYRLSEQIDVLVAEMETIQQKIELMRESNSTVWEKIYETQFEAVYFRFRCVEAELSERRSHIDGLKKHIRELNCKEAAQLSGSSRTINCMPAYDIAIIQETQSLVDNIVETKTKIIGLSSEIDAFLSMHEDQLKFLDSVLLLPQDAFE